MQQLFRKAFDGKQNVLVKNIDCDHGLWAELWTRKVLTEEQLNDCKSSAHVCCY